MLKMFRAAAVLAISAAILSPISAQAFTNAAGAVPVEKKSQAIEVAVRKAVPDKYKRRVVRLVTTEKPGTIIIDTHNKFLYYVQGKNRAVRYGVGVGRDGYGWSGVVKIGRKAEWPEWRPPAEMRAREARKGHNLPVVQKGGIDNPLGARAMYLYRGGQDTIFRIHGTNQPWSIGLNMSSGCIRMMNKDVEDLYARAGVGTKVIVVGPGNREGDVVYDDRGIDLLATIFGG